MKVVVKDESGKTLQKFWGNLVCVHDLEKGVFKTNELNGSLTVEVEK